MTDTRETIARAIAGVRFEQRGLSVERMTDDDVAACVPMADAALSAIQPRTVETVEELRDLVYGEHDAPLLVNAGTALTWARSMYLSGDATGLPATVLTAQPTVSAEAVIEYVGRVVNDPKYSHDAKWLAANLTTDHLRQIAGYPTVSAEDVVEEEA